MSDPEKSENNELFELLLYAMDGRMSDAQFTRLEELLSEKSDAIEDYVRFVMMYVALNQTQGTYISALPTTSDGTQKIDQDLQKAIENDEQAVIKSAAEEAAWQAKNRKEEVRTNAEALLEKFKAEELRRQQELAYKQYKAQRRNLICTVASLTVLLVIVAFAWLSGLMQQTSPFETISKTASPPVVATVTNVYQAKGSRPDAFVVGAALTPGSLDLKAGTIEITFQNDATLILEAPVEVNLVTERLIRLSSGTVTAHVPVSAKGFEIEAPSVCVMDLGTCFGMVVHEHGITDVHVFNGCVATSFDRPQQNERDRIKTLYTNDAMRFDAKDGKVEKIQTIRQQFALTWDDVLYQPRTSGPVRFERTPPSTFLQDGNDNYVTILLESTDRYLSHHMTVDITEPGHYEKFGGLSETLSVGLRVDSYLIHWKPTSEIVFDKTMTGSVTFSRPILGLIVQDQKLRTSRRLFQDPGILYLNDQHQGLESIGSEHADTVTLSQDRCTLTFSLLSKMIDQVRILVPAHGR